ncbi:MAG: hypothetical protein LE168_02205 [Endomicrobium sp.]|nr:hypothetical protein [Endomicrobium sp.]
MKVKYEHCGDSSFNTPSIHGGVATSFVKNGNRNVVVNSHFFEKGGSEVDEV